MSEQHMPNLEPKDFKGSDETFWKWLVKQSWLLISQVTVGLSIIGFFASFIYYISHGEFSEYLEPGRIQTLIFWMHIIILAIFIGWLLWIRDEPIDDEKAKRTVKSVFRKNIKEHEAEHAQSQLKKFKFWFLIFWIAMGSLYTAFFIQRYSIPDSKATSPYSSLTSKEKIFSIFQDASKKNKEYREKDESAHTIEAQTEFRKESEKFVSKLNQEIEESGEYDIYSKIKSLEPNRLQHKIDDIINQLKDPAVDTTLKRNDILLAPVIAPTDTKTSSKGRKPAVFQTPTTNEVPKHQEIYADIWQAAVTRNEARRIEYIEQAQGKVLALLQNNNLNDQEKKIFNDIKNLDSDEFNKNIDEIAELIKKSENRKNNSEVNLTKTIFACVTYILNTFGLWVVFVLYLITLAPDEQSLSKEKKYKNISLVFFVILSLSSLSLFAVLNNESSKTDITTWIVFFDGLSGVLNAVALAMLIARLDSKLIGLPSILISVLYFYAAIQPLFVVFEQPGEISQIIKTVVLIVVFISKIYFFLIITYAIQSGRLLTYLYCYPIISKSVDMIYANPFRIEITESAGKSAIEIFRDKDAIFSEEYSEKYLDENETSIAGIIDELKRCVEKEDENKEVYIKIRPTTRDKYQIMILGEKKELICESTDESMTKAEAAKLRIESIKYIPFCDPKITNKSKQAREVNDKEPTSDGEAGENNESDETE